MNFHVLTPLMTSLTLTAVVGVCARSHHLSTDVEDVFGISPAVGYLMLVFGVLFCIAPFFPGASGDISPGRFFWYFAPFWGGTFLAAVFFFRYRVVIRDSTLTVGAWRRRQIPFSEVIDWDVLQGGRSPELWVYLKGGERLKFSGLLSDFDELVGMVNSHMEGLPGPRHDSVEKLYDRDKRKRESRAANWYVGVGILIVAIVLFVLWRMQLM